MIEITDNSLIADTV